MNLDDMLEFEKNEERLEILRKKDPLQTGIQNSKQLKQQLDNTLEEERKKSQERIEAAYINHSFEMYRDLKPKEREMFFEKYIEEIRLFLLWLYKIFDYPSIKAVKNQQPLAIEVLEDDDLIEQFMKYRAL